MFTVTIKPTQNPSVVKFEFPDFISYGTNYEFKNIDEAKNSPLAQRLFYLPFVKTVYISGNFVAIERFSIVEWSDVQHEVKTEIENFIKNGGKVLIDTDDANTKKSPVSVYAESTPNPGVMKFVANKLLSKNTLEYKNIDETVSSDIAKALFNFPFVKEVFIDENYISITKYESFDWNDIVMEVRSFIKEYIENGGSIVDESKIPNEMQEETKEAHFESLDTTSQQIVNIIEEYIKPAVAGDGGNIAFQGFNPETKQVKVILQGACSGCPSSTFTLKNGIENMLRQMLNDNGIVVDAMNG
ncbi:NifU family protein [Avrilella dinanensis]|uniref:Scaffold protein Nfu/NifU N-terminal domain-containing protein n=1 Tax=Avrilella dinanensis TaxID=2008672 RepID=A0A2M9R7V4_9FLAO|nr:NifU family protein [Avrilella dinanensis]PJR04793.1 hypothetical protein CDL10_09765 [Avrilella dinanensis]